MQIAHYHRVFAFVVWLVVGGAALAQETEEPAPPASPDLSALGQNWWTYFEGAPDDVGTRVDSFLELLHASSGPYL